MNSIKEILDRVRHSVSAYPYESESFKDMKALADEVKRLQKIEGDLIRKVVNRQDWAEEARSQRDCLAKALRKIYKMVDEICFYDIKHEPLSLGAIAQVALKESNLPLQKITQEKV